MLQLQKASRTHQPNMMMSSSTYYSTTTTKTTTTTIVSSSSPLVSMNEISLQLSDGMTVAGQRWTYNNHSKDDPNHHGSNQSTTTTTKNTQRILALHGWLDNCASFHYLAPNLISRLGENAELVALDLPGHGWSSHKSVDGPPMLLSEALYYVSDVLDQLGWVMTAAGEGKPEGRHNNKNKNDSRVDGNNNATTTTSNNNDHHKITLVGHSMGGGISMAYAATFPEQVDKVVMIDVYGPLPGDVDRTTSVLRSHIERRKKGKRPHKFYPTLEKAIETRMLTAMKAPGNQSLSREAATALVKRATMPAKAPSSSSSSSSSPANDNDVAVVGGYQFRHDTRLLWPSIQYLMPEQVEHMMKAVECPVCLIAAEDGWPFKARMVETSLQMLDPTIYKTLPGSHHLHADPETAGPVMDVVYDFIAGRNMTYVI